MCGHGARKEIPCPPPDDLPTSVTRRLRAESFLIAPPWSVATIEYNYTPPIHFGVREGHRDIADSFWMTAAGARWATALAWAGDRPGSGASRQAVRS